MNEKTKDIGYSIAKGVLGSIPIAGAVASELLQLIVTSPLDKRRMKWMEEVGEKLKSLEKSHSLNLEKLQENEIFIDVVLQCSQEVLKTSEKAKIICFQNAIINTAIGENPELAEIQIYLKLISDFTVWHIKIIKFFDSPEEWLSENNCEVPNYAATGLSSILLIAYPELKEKRDFYELIWDDLKRSGMHKSSTLHTTVSGNGLMSSRTTQFAKRFLKFISDYSEE